MWDHLLGWELRGALAGELVSSQVKGDEGALRAMANDWRQALGGKRWTSAESMTKTATRDGL